MLLRKKNIIKIKIGKKLKYFNFFSILKNWICKKKIWIVVQIIKRPKEIETELKNLKSEMKKINKKEIRKIIKKK